MQTDIKVGLAGCGHRGIAGLLASIKAIGKAETVVGLFDHNPIRLDYAHNFLGNPHCRKSTNFDAFCSDPNLDTVIVATPDNRHAEYVIKTFAAGKNVVCEKPMAISTEDCRTMIEAQGDNQFRVAFNFRCNAVAIKTKELLDAGTIGRVLLVDAHDTVDWRHGSDYFRRWHRFQSMSGGLPIHKSTHAFDVIDWWLDDVAESVSAEGGRNFYKPSLQQGERCLTCNATASCPFAIDLAGDIPGQNAGIDGFYKDMYLDAESHDGYIRDACVFDANSDILDNYTASATYRSGARLSYTAVFFAPNEDRTFVIYGDKGQMEISRQKRQIKIHAEAGRTGCEIIDVPEEPGGHGGADMRFVKSIYGSEDPYGVCADAKDGFSSIALGESLNRSITSGQRIAVPQLED